MQDHHQFASTNHHFLSISRLSSSCPSGITISLPDTSYPRWKMPLRLLEKSPIHLTIPVLNGFDTEQIKNSRLSQHVTTLDLGTAVSNVNLSHFTQLTKLIVHELTLGLGYATGESSANWVLPSSLKSFSQGLRRRGSDDAGGLPLTSFFILNLIKQCPQLEHIDLKDGSISCIRALVSELPHLNSLGVLTVTSVTIMAQLAQLGLASQVSKITSIEVNLYGDTFLELNEELLEIIQLQSLVNLTLYLQSSNLEASSQPWALLKLLRLLTHLTIIVMHGSELNLNHPGICTRALSEVTQLTSLVIMNQRCLFDERPLLKLTQLKHLELSNVNRLAGLPHINPSEHHQFKEERHQHLSNLFPHCFVVVKS